MESPILILDFETSGLSPDLGDRVIEVGVVRIESGRITDRFQSLMNPGLRISSFIEHYTGITNTMLRQAPPVAEVMEQLANFLGDTPLVAHNASFDRKFLDAELHRIDRCRNQDVLCSVRVSRRVYPRAGRHSLGALVEYLDLPNNGVFHRALADAELTAHLWLRICADLCRRHGFGAVPLAVLADIQGVPVKKAEAYLRKAAGR